MKCQRCEFDNEAGAKFCGQCGASMTSSGPAVAQSTPPVSQVRCPRCGKANYATSVFCEHCGTSMSMAAQPVTSDAIPAPTPVKKVSSWWWLLPIFFGWIGGLIAWLVVKETDKKMAVTLLWVGIGLSVFWAIVSIVLTIVLYSIA